MYRRDRTENPPLWKGEESGVAGVPGAAAPEGKERRIVIDVVGSKEVTSSRMGVRGKDAKRREPRPPDPDEISIIDHFQRRMTERMGGPVPFITPADKKALRTFRWGHQGDPCATTEKLLKCVDNACASDANLWIVVQSTSFRRVRTTTTRMCGKKAMWIYACAAQILFS